MKYTYPILGFACTCIPIIVKPVLSLPSILDTPSSGYSLKHSNQTTLHTSVAYEYFFSTNRMLQNLLPLINNKGSITISGSQVPNRSPDALLADYFYLPTDFSSTINLKAHIHEIDTAINLQQRLPTTTPIVLRCFIPVSIHYTHLDTQETVIHQGTLDHSPGYFVPDNEFTAQKALSTARLFFEGASINDNPISTGLDRTVFQPLAYSLWNSRPDYHATFGCNVELLYVWNHTPAWTGSIGFLIQSPTGNQTSTKQLLSPTLRNNNHWQLGGTITLEGLAYETEHIRLRLAHGISFQYQCSSDSYRVFDLYKKPMSRYMLAQKLGAANESDHLTIGQVDATSQFKKEFAPIANLTHLAITSHIPFITTAYLQGELAYQSYAIQTAFSWIASTPERINLAHDNLFANNQTWALKGDSYVYGFKKDILGNATAIPIPATQTNATITGGTNFVKVKNTQDIINGQKNSGIDHKNIVQSNGILLMYSPTVPGRYQNITFASQSAEYITEQSIDIDTARIQYAACTLSNTIRYTSQNPIDNWIPSIGLGTSITWGIGSNALQRPSYRTWTTYLEFGLSY